MGKGIAQSLALLESMNGWYRGGRRLVKKDLETPKKTQLNRKLRRKERETKLLKLSEK